MKRIIIGSVFLLGFSGWAQAQQKTFTPKQLCKKWHFSHYQVFYFREGPSDNEKGDYIHLKADMSYSSADEGIAESGTWSLDPSRARLTLTRIDKEALTFIIKKLESKHLVLVIDDPTDADAQLLDIHFKSN